MIHNIEEQLDNPAVALDRIPGTRKGFHLGIEEGMVGELEPFLGVLEADVTLCNRCVQVVDDALEGRFL